jgi:phosphoribosylaminoimidazolecarboxamide formyltransferase/IMP cyclohydrolase
MSSLVATPITRSPLNILRALVSVSNKDHLDILAKCFLTHNIEVLSTGGTAKTLRELGVTVLDVADYTGFPEMMDGRVKTLHPRIHGGILGRKGIDDDVLAEHDIGYFDLVVVNLYPFAETIADPDCSYEVAVENIDIGGPSMLRAAAKNHAHISVITDPNDYAQLSQALASNNGSVDFENRQRWAAKAFAHSADYETMIAQYLQTQLASADTTEVALNVNLPTGELLRYGENPHQQARFFRQPSPEVGTLGAAELLQGKALSYNNLADADAALECIKSFPITDGNSCVIVKHANPCGVALADSQHAAYLAAYASDPTSAFGGILAFNSDLDQKTAEQIVSNQYAEVILAPTISSAALATLAKKPNIRVLATGQWQDFSQQQQLKVISGGILQQNADVIRQTAADWKVVSKRLPSEQEWQDLRFAWAVARFVKSNAIVFVKNQRTIGIGAGQMSRVISVKIAAMKAHEEDLETKGAVMASDAFFPFADGLEAALAEGLTAVIHPGGSMRDDEVIAAADKAEIAMVMTGTRHFRH